MKNVRMGALILVTAFVAGSLGCTSGGSGEKPVNTGSKQNEPVHPEEQQPLPSGEISSDLNDSLDTVATEMCPYGLKEHAVYAAYQRLNVEVEVECRRVDDNQLYFTAGDLEKALQFLAKHQEFFRDWENRPKTIRFGQTAYHDSKKSLIQLPVDAHRAEDLDNYLHDTRLLMDFEFLEFNREIRISYNEYEMMRSPSGDIIEIGRAGPLGYGPSRAKIIHDDLKTLRRYKKEIHALKEFYPNIVLFHGNQFGYFKINYWNRNYTFAAEVQDSDQKQFFAYLHRLQTVRNLYGEVAVHVGIMTYPRADFTHVNGVLDVLIKLRDRIIGLGFEALQIKAPVFGALQQRLTVATVNSTLVISNVVTNFGKLRTAEEIATCLEKADFSKPDTYYCDGDGRGRGSNMRF